MIFLGEALDAVRASPNSNGVLFGKPSFILRLMGNKLPKHVVLFERMDSQYKSSRQKKKNKFKQFWLADFHVYLGREKKTTMIFYQDMKMKRR